MTNPSTLDRILHNHDQSCEIGTGARGAARLAVGITTLCNGAVSTMKTLKTLKALAVATALVCGLSATPANAAFIDGSIAFFGFFTPTGSSDLATATGIDITNSFVFGATGDFAPANNAPATFVPLVFAPASNVPLTPFWTVNTAMITYTFDLTSLSLDMQTSTALNLSGSGTLMATGFEDTVGNWTFSGDSLGSFFTFSSITAANPTPIAEPVTLLLVGLGLTGIAMIRRKRQH